MRKLRRILVAEGLVRTASDWRDTEVQVRGKSMTLGLVLGGKLYHGSPHKLPPGTVLKPRGSESNYAQSSGKGVSITSDRGRAEHWGSLEGEVPGYVYEVEPLGEVEAHRVGPANRFKNFNLWEGVVPAAKILREV
jgi:hypothetical protein